MSDNHAENMSRVNVPTYANPLDEKITWSPVKIRIPLLWWFLFVMSLIGSLIVALVVIFHQDWLVLSWRDSMRTSLLMVLTFSIAIGGFMLTMALIKKPLFPNRFHVLYVLTAFLWGFGGVAGFSSLVVTRLIDLAFLASSRSDIISLIIPIGVWTGFVAIIPVAVIRVVLPQWENRASVLRIGIFSAFWGAYAGTMMTLVAPYASATRPVFFAVMAIVAILPIGGIVALGVGVAFPVRWKVSSFAIVNVLAGVLIVAYGTALLLLLVLVTDMSMVLTVVVWAQILLFSVLGPIAFIGSLRSYDPALEQDMEGLQVWVDADVLRPEELEFLSDEVSIRLWEREAVRRGVFYAARDYYRALTRLAFMSFQDERTHSLVETVKITRRQLEAAGIPPRPDFLEFSDVPIFPNLMGGGA